MQVLGHPKGGVLVWLEGGVLSTDLLAIGADILHQHVSPGLRNVILSY
jgi:hypothetical protein